MKERTIQNYALVALSQAFVGRGIFWPNETGQAYVKLDHKKPLCEKNKRPIRYGLVGSSDILGCVDGLMICIEMKTKTGKQREAQKLFQAAIERCGGIYFIARSADEAVEKLKTALAERV